MNFDKVLREARNKVSGICGCTKETSCYGCLRNYSNQYFHDRISRGLAYDYISWLLDSEKSTQREVIKTEPAKQVEKEKIGIKTFVYDAPDTSAYPDVISQFESLRDSAEDEGIKKGYEKLLIVAQDGSYEHPITEEKLPAKEKDIWPEIFWGKSHVALFTRDAVNQYNILRKYDWYCYFVDENINAEIVLSHVQKGV